MALNKKRDIILVIIGVLVAIAFVAGVVFLITTSVNNNPPDNEVVQTPEPEQTTRPTVPDYNQEVVIEQDRTLKFDNLKPAEKGVEVGIVEISFDDYVNYVDGSAEIYRVKAYDATDGFYVRPNSIFNLMSGSGTLMTSDGYCDIQIREYYNGLGTYETCISNRLSEMGISEHQAEFKMKMDYALTESKDDDPDWSYQKGGMQFIGAKKFDVSEYGYEDCYMILRKTAFDSYCMTCYLKVSEDRCLSIVLNDKTDEFFEGYLTELLKNCLVVF